MAINLITGLPGHGKSLYTLWHVKQRVEQDNKDLIAAGKEPRSVYYNGIPELTLDWVQFDHPEKWHELPPGSIIVIDEAQRTFRPRGNAASVPAHVQALEVHRHKGHDLYVITQHPLLVDGNLRRLVDRHYHVMRPFGWTTSTVLDYQGVKDQPAQKSNRADAQKSKFVFPKELYQCYKSAEVHTVKKRIPGKLLFLLALPLILGIMGYFAWTKLKTASGQNKPVASSSSPGQKPDAIPGGAQGSHMSRDDYIRSYDPRVAGLHYTAPRYDDVTKPVRAPTPDACMANTKQCKCYTKQATVLAVPDALCRQIVEKGFYRDFDDNDQNRGNQAQPVQAFNGASSAGRDQFVQLGGTAPASIDPRHAATSATPTNQPAPTTRPTTNKNLSLPTS